jgi:hypothetical protein
MQAVRANVRDGSRQISLATEDLFVWGQIRTGTPFYFPNREALLDLFADVVNYPGVEQHVLSHCTIAPAVVDPVLIRELSNLLLDKSPVHLPLVSTHPRKEVLSPLTGLETGSVRMARQIMPGKGAGKLSCFPLEEDPTNYRRGAARAILGIRPGHPSRVRSSASDASACAPPGEDYAAPCGLSPV